MKTGGIRGSFTAQRQGRSGSAAQDRARSLAADREAPPLPIEPPGWLPPAAQEIWREVLPHVLDRARAADARQFASWCVASAEVVRWSTSQAKNAGERLRAFMRVQLAIGSALGLTPRGRAALPPARRPDPRNECEATIASLII
jgi:phage terminase small subunit